jgi:glycerate 2-kinase
MALMRVLICPDKFAGTISAVEVARAVADGWRAARADDEFELRPLSDGGPGFVEVIAEARTDARRVPVPTTDPLGRPVPGEVLVDGATAYVESAQACGLHLLTEDERDPKRTTSHGLGVLITAAIESGARRVVVGLGGSATNDAGSGLLGALGATPLDAAGRFVGYGGAALTRCTRLAGTPRLRDATLVAATDVDNPLLGLHGASAVYGPQKGASREDVMLLDGALSRFSQVLEKDLEGCPAGVAELPGAGAAGGLGAALLALGGAVTSGIGLVRDLVGLDRLLDEVDLVITGEGAFDEQSLRGKVVAGVASAARDRGVPCVVLAGRIAAGRREAAAIGVTEMHSLVDHFQDVTAALERPAEGLRALGTRLAGQWSR